MDQEPLTAALRETLAVFDGSGEPRTTPEVAERLDLGRRSAYARLERLAERGRLETKKVGANARVWWRPPTDAAAPDGRAIETRASDDVEACERETDVEAYERELERYARVVETVDDGIYVLDGENRFTLVNDGFVSMTGYDREDLLGAHATRVFGDPFVDVADEKQAELESGSRDVAVLEEVLSRADGSELVVESRFDRFAVEGGTGRVGVVRDVSERVARKRELERQREQLAALNSLNAVVRELTGAVVERSTREEIEATVCDHLADSDSYLFAWVGDVDAATQTVTTRAEAGVEGYLEGITISVDPDDVRSEGPTGRAFRTGEVQTTRDVDADARHDVWRDHVERHGVRSSAAIPIVHGETTYGVLNVYADRPNAFEGREGEVIAQIGEITGHAIAAAERKRALMSDELVELEFRIRDVFAALGVPVETAGTITLDHAIQVADEEFLVYGTATPDAVDTVGSLVETLPHWEAVDFHSPGTPTGFELRLSEPPVLSVVASLGGSVDAVVIEDGDYRMRLSLAPSVEVRRVIDAVEASYPQAELLRRRQYTRSPDDLRRIQRRLVADLTDRQATALEAAYRAGYFEWPRETAAEGVAASLGVAPSTFHQHLRKAERKAFDLLFSTRVGTDV